MCYLFLPLKSAERMKKGVKPNENGIQTLQLELEAGKQISEGF